MKKSINITGVVFLMFLFTGIIFKRFNVPGAGILTTLGMVLFITVYLPVFLFSLSKQMKSEGSSQNKFLLFIGSTGIMILSFGILSKIMHWPGANIGLWSGIGLISFTLLIYLVINRKANEKISMISVLIAIILLGSFSFNTFRFGNMRSMEDAYAINGAAFSESSDIFRKECEILIHEKVITDTTILSLPNRRELFQFHSLVQETDFVIGNMIENLRTAQNPELYSQSASQKSGAISEIQPEIILEEEGLVAMDRKISALITLINSMNEVNPEEKDAITSMLVYPFEQQDSGLQFKYLGTYNLLPDICINTLLIWKCKIWETEHRILDMILEK